jgi:thiol-disulfide isomerase/thioredoxin
MRKELTREGVYQELERMWPDAGAAHDGPADLALPFLSRTDSAARILRWVDRARVRHPARDGAETLLRFRELRDEGLRRLRARIARLRAFSDEERGLFQTREQFRASAGAESRAGYATLGTALVEAGNRRGGLDTLALAVAGGWEPRTFRTVAELRLSAGDTAAALPLLARVAADPGTSPAFADTALRRLGGKVGTDRWRAALSSAREEMQRGVLAASVSRAVPEIRLTAPDSTVRALHQVATGRPVVVVFWSRNCGPVIQALPEITRLARRTHVIPITEEPPSAAFRDYWKGHPGAPPVWHDTRREARRAFGSFGTPQYFVIDQKGRPRFELTSLDEIPRQLAALN